MKITWQDNRGKEVTGRIDAHLWLYVEALGVDGAARLFLAFGGSYVYFPRSGASRNGQLVRLLGQEGLERLIDTGKVGGGMRIPVANTFLARYLRSKGQSINKICRQIRSTDVHVRALLKDDETRRVISKNSVWTRDEAAE